MSFGLTHINQIMNERVGKGESVKEKGWRDGVKRKSYKLKGKLGTLHFQLHALFAQLFPMILCTALCN